MGSRITARTVTQTSLVTDSNVCSDSDQNIKLLKESNHVSSESVSLNQSMAIYACTGNVEGVISLTDRGINVNSFDERGLTPLHNATSKNDTSMIVVLVDRGAMVDAPTSRESSFPGVTPLHVAAIFGNEEAIRTLHKLGASLNIQDSAGNTPLHICINKGNRDLARCLISLGADVTVCGDNGSALHHAAELGNIEMIHLLVDSGCPSDIQDGQGATPTDSAVRSGMVDAVVALHKIAEGFIICAENMCLAAANDDIELLHLMIGIGVPVDIKDKDGITPLHIAAILGSLMTCKVLILYGAAVNVTDPKGFTPLMWAAKMGQKDIVLFLINNGADVTWLADDFGGAIHQAAVSGHGHIIKCLVDNGCPVDLQTSSCNATPLHVASNNEGALNSCMELISLGADVNARTDGENTPLIIASQQGHKDIVLYLINNGADITWVAKDVGGAIHQAAFNGHVSVICCLVDKGCPVDLRAKYGTTSLHAASSKGALNSCIELISLGADVNARDDGEQTPLMLASLKGHKDIVLYLINNGADITWVAKDVGGAIHQAAINGHVSVICCLVDKGCPVDLRAKYGTTSLHATSVNGALNSCIELISLGADVNARDDGEQTPLMLASLKGHKDIVLYLINNGADITWVAKDVGGAIHQAAINGHVSVICCLVDKGCPVDLRAKYGTTSLHATSVNGALNSCIELISLGADVNARDDGEQTPLMLASLKGHKDIVLYLINNGADITWVAKDVGGAIHQAAFNGHVSVICCLVDKGCPVDLRAKYGTTSLHAASSKGALNSCIELISLGADVNARDDGETTPLMLASQQGHKDIVLYLINNGADISWVAKEYGGAIHQAARSDYVHIINCLVDTAMCPIDLKSEEVYTPLHYASIGGALNACEELIALGADVNAKNGEGKTPLIVASQYGHEEVVQCLIDNGADTALMMKADGGALHQAAGLGRTKVVACLIRNGVSVNQLTSKGHSPLFYAAIGGSKDICELLLSIMKDPARHVDVLAGLGSYKFSSEEQIIKWYMLCKDVCFKFLQSKLSDEVYSLREAWEVFYSETFTNFLWHMIFHRDHDEIKEIITKVLQGFISIFSNLSKSDYIRMNSRLLHGAAFYGTFDMISMLPNFSYELREHKNVSDFALMYFKGQDYSSRFTSVTPLHVCLHVLDIEKLNAHVQSIYLTFIGKMVLVDPGIVHDQLPDGSTPLDLAIKFKLFEAVSIIHAAGGQTNPFTITRRETLSQELKQCYDTMYQKILLINTVSDSFQQRKIAEDIVEMLKSTFQIDTSAREAKEPYLETNPTKEQLLQIVAPKIEDRWYKVATFLDLDEDYIDDVREDKSLSKSDKCFVILKKWLKSDPNPTWRVLVDAISKTDVTFQIKSHLDRTEANIRSSDSQSGQLCTLAQNRANRELDFGHSKIFNLPSKQQSFDSPYSIAVFNNIILPQVAARWEFFAYSLGVEVELVKIIKTNHPSDVERCCGNLFIRWLNSDRNTGGKPRNWETVKTALLDSHHEKVCDNLEALLSSGSQSEMISCSEDQNNINVSLGSIPTMVTRDNVGIAIPIEDRSYIEPAPPHRLQGETSPVDLDPSDLPISQSCISIINNIVIHEVAAEWEKVGIYLGFNIAVLKTIERTFVHSDRLVYCCKEMFDKWLAKDYGTGDLPRTWRTVVIAIRDSGYGALAEDLWTGRYQPS